MNHMQYDWDTGPGCCAVHQFNKTHLCQIFSDLGIKSLMVVGDSINEMWANSLYLMMKYPNNNGQVGPQTSACTVLGH